MQAHRSSSRPIDHALAPASERDDDLLDASTIAHRLLASGRQWRVGVVATTGSTNTDLLADVRRTAGADLPALLVARHQSAGRGRLGRTWQSDAPRSLTVSFALPIACRIGRLEGITLDCGLAVGDVVSRLGVDARLKWPNDVLVDQRKLAGILVEAHALGASTALVVGVGINLVGIADPAGGIGATSLRDAGVVSVDRNALVAGIAEALAERITAFEQSGFAPSAAAWRAMDAYAGRAVVVRCGDEAPVTGLHAGIDGSGALLVDVDGGRRRYSGGDISLRLAS